MESDMTLCMDHASRFSLNMQNYVEACFEMSYVFRGFSRQ